jgi:hypothetical protein
MFQTFSYQAATSNFKREVLVTSSTCSKKSVTDEQQFHKQTAITY